MTGGVVSPPEGPAVATLSNCAVSVALTLDPAMILKLTLVIANGSGADASVIQVPGAVAPAAYSKKRVPELSRKRSHCWLVELYAGQLGVRLVSPLPLLIQAVRVLLATKKYA